VRSSKASAVANEQLVAEVRRHELGLVGIAVRLAVVVGLAGALWAVIEVWLPPKTLWVSASKWTVAVVLGLLVVFSVGRRFAGWANARLEVTDQRIRIRYRLRKAGWDIPLLSIVEITYVSGPVQRLFGVGVLRVQTSFAPLPAFMLDVADVKQLSQEILVLRNQAWDRHIRSYNQPGSTGELRAAS
jgi:membrane protein YdbS with pleckstrin-like domain